MSQEAIMIAIDNSDFMRNGDYNPSRHQAQIEAFNYFCNAKKRMNVENTCGLITMANNQVVCTLTTDVSKLHSKITLVELGGEISFCTTVRVAQLALRHRQSRNQKPRIVVFVGSSISADSVDDIIKLAKKLKKEKVSVDVISFGENEDNQEKLSTFIDTVNGKDNSSGTSHLVTIPPGSSLQESLRTSPILMPDDGVLNNTGPGGFGLDEIDDPDLAYAIRVSMEDQRMQQERAAGMNEELPGGLASGTGGDTSEEAMLREAMAASLGTVGTNATSTGGATNTGRETAASGATNDDMFVDLSSMTEEEQIAYAMRMSLQDECALLLETGDGRNESETKPDDDKTMETEESGAGATSDTNKEKDDDEKDMEQEKYDVLDNPELVDGVLEQMDQGTDDKQKNKKNPGGDS